LAVLKYVMPLPGKQWRHLTFGTHNSWLPGDPRGFRDRHHKLHSSGDHRNPPPAGEYAKLNEHARQISGRPVLLEQAHRQIVLRSIYEKLHQLDHRCVVAACCAMHVHVLVELPDDLPEIKKITGKLKRSASTAIRDQMPGRIWARGGNYEPVKNKAHQRAVYQYILRHRKAWVWSYKSGQYYND